MNTTLLSVPLAASILFVACSQNSPAPTEPAGMPAAQAPPGAVVPPSSHPLETARSSHTIHENVVLEDPVISKDLVEVVGDVHWELYPSPELGRNAVNVALTFDALATLSTSSSPARWSIDGKDSRTIDLSSKDLARVEVVYGVTGSPEPMDLHIEYLVTAQDVRVNDLWLTSAAVVR